MLRIAVTGPIGSGKTTLLEDFAEWAAERGRAVNGALAVAEGARHPGADRYALRFLDGSAPAVLATRQPDGPPMYAFDDAAWSAAGDWAATLADAKRPWLVVLDEFGPLEATGGGWMAHWPLVEAAHAGIVALAVRDGEVERIAKRLGHSFDAVVRADDPDALQTLIQLGLSHDDWSRVGLFGAGSGGLEATLGSFLHGARIPMRGLVMSSAQGAVMTEAGRDLGRRDRVVWVPFLAAGLKALSPAGSRLRPMLAISIQGILFTAATRLLGWTTAGIGLGGALIGAWAAAQGFFLQWLLVGEELFRAYTAVADGVQERFGWTVPALWVLVVALSLVWALVSGTVSTLVHRRGGLPERMRSAMARIPSRKEATAGGRAAAIRAGLVDLARPTFWLPILLIVALIAVSGSSAERIAWVAVRALTVGALLMIGARLVRPQRALGWLRRRGVWGPAVAMDEAMRRRDPR